MDTHRRVDSDFERTEVKDPTPSPLGRVGRVLGGIVAIIGMLGGTALIMLGVIAQFDVRSTIHPLFRPVAVYSSFDDKPVELQDIPGGYAVTSLRSALDSCTVRSIFGGPTVALEKDPGFENRSVFPISVGKGTYEVRCEPGTAWYEVYKGTDVERAVKGYEGDIHPSIYYFGAGVAFFLVGNFFWKRYIMKPREW